MPRFLFSVKKKQGKFYPHSSKLFLLRIDCRTISHISTYFRYIWTRRETAHCASTTVNPGSLINQESLEIPIWPRCSGRYYYAYAERRDAVVICQANVKQNSPISNRRTIQIHGEWLREVTVWVINLKRVCRADGFSNYSCLYIILHRNRPKLHVTLITLKS